MTWLLVVFLSLAGDSKIWVKAYCVPKSVPQKEGEKK